MTHPGGVGLIELFIVIALSSLISVGGGNGPLAMIQSRWVDGGMLEPTLFAWAVALGYLCPGPKAGFVAGIGYYLHGVAGALAAVIGIMVPTCLGSAAVSYAYDRFGPLIRRVSLPASFVVAGMIAAAAWHVAKPMQLSGSEIGVLLFVALMVAWRNVEPVLLVTGAAVAGVVWWWLT